MKGRGVEAAAAAMMAMALSAGALAQSGSNGVYGGYVGSSRQFQMEMESARNRAAVQHALEQRNGGDQGAGSGAQVDVHVSFPAEQRGIANITTVSLQPKDEGAHSALTLAVFDRQTNAINATFIPKKDVKPGHSYGVVLQDARGGKYPIGEIRVDKSGQKFELASPLLGQSSSTTQAKAAPEQKQQETSSYTPPKVGSGYVRPQVGAGYVRPQSR